MDDPRLAVVGDKNLSFRGLGVQRSVGALSTLRCTQDDLSSGPDLARDQAVKVAPLRTDCVFEGRKDGDLTYWFDEGSGFDAESRGDREYNQKNYVVEKYVRGLLVKTTHYKDGKPID